MTSKYCPPLARSLGAALICMIPFSPPGRLYTQEACGSSMTTRSFALILAGTA